MSTEFDSRPIGIFDSGVGGLTVLQALMRRFPSESFIYLGDTARVPYGNKSARTVERYTLQVADFLLRYDVKALVVACNTASALGLSALRAHTSIPVQGVIQPGCRAAVEMSKGGCIGVIGTRTTIASGAYPHTLYLLDPTVRVISQACPLFVPLVEEGWVNHAVTRMIIEENLRSLKISGIDTLILGCTHYPPLKALIADVLGHHIQLVDSPYAVARALESRLQDLIRPAKPEIERQTLFLVTDVAERFREVAKHFLEGIPVEKVEMVDL
ncbi:MAG: glutamate racemase [Magnetococcus sp. DMHC-6]